MRRADAPRVAVALCLAAAVAAAGEPATGRRVYQERCAACHGDEGRGDGPAAMALVPKPRNFRDAGIWRARTASQLRLVVRDGRPGTMMAPFRDVLSDEEIDAVVAYVEGFRPGGASRDGQAPDAGAR